MNGYKIVKFWGSNCGDVKFGFVAPDGKVKDLPVVGRIWEQQGDKWVAPVSVVESKVAGLLMFEMGKSKVAKPLNLKSGQVYLPLAVTGWVHVLKTLPTV